MSIESPKSSPSATSADSQLPGHNGPHLRLWPGVAIVAVLWTIREGVQLLPPSPPLFQAAYMFAPMVATVAMLGWWFFGSRLPWAERLTTGLAIILIAVATVFLTLKTLTFMGLLFYALPVLLTAWVSWLLRTYRQAWPARRTGLIAAIALVCGFISLVRLDGMDGSFNPSFSWRWTPTAEDRMFASLTPAAAAPAAESQPAETTADAPATSSQSARLELSPGDWPGFRGTARDGRLSGVEIATDWQASPPRQLWKHLIGPGWSSLAVIGDRVFTQEQRGDEELVVCYDAATGAEVWAHKDAARFSEVVAGPGPRGTPTFDDGLIYAQGASGKLNCLDAATGAVVWTRDVMADSGAKLPMWGFASSPLVVHGIVTVFAGGPEQKSVLAYNAKTGELAWAAGEGSLSYCSPQLSEIDGVEQLLIATEVGLTAFRPETGEVLWTHEWPTGSVARIIQPALLDKADFLIGTGLGVGTRRIHVGHDGDAWPTEELWTTRSIKPYYNDLVVAGDSLYGFDGNIFMCVGLADGTVHWKKRGYGNGQVLLLADQNLLLILTEEGEVALVEAQSDKHKEIGRFKALEGKTWNHPVIAHGKLFVRNAEEVACFELAPLADAQARASDPTSAQ
jgi:outer membrane protein assembly factor BamB